MVLQWCFSDVTVVLQLFYSAVTESRQKTTDSKQQTADSRQQTADSRQQTADSGRTAW
jgi:hypothetical protein